MRLDENSKVRFVLVQIRLFDDGTRGADPVCGFDRVEWIGHRPSAATRSAPLSESSQGISRGNLAGVPLPLARSDSRGRAQVRGERPLVCSPSRGGKVTILPLNDHSPSIRPRKTQQVEGITMVL